MDTELSFQQLSRIAECVDDTFLRKRRSKIVRWPFDRRMRTARVSVQCKILYFGGAAGGLIALEIPYGAPIALRVSATTSFGVA